MSPENSFGNPPSIPQNQEKQGTPDSKSEAASPEASHHEIATPSAEEQQALAAKRAEEAAQIANLTTQIHQSLEREVTLAQKIIEILKKLDAAEPFDRLARSLTIRQENRFNDIVNPDQVRELALLGIKLKELLEKKDIAMSDLELAFQRHDAVLRALFENLPTAGVIRDDTESLLDVGNRFADIARKNTDIVNDISNADSSNQKSESAGLARILTETNKFIYDRDSGGKEHGVIPFINRRLDAIEGYLS